MFCLDTDTLAAALLADPPLRLVRRLARTPAAEQCTTSVTLGELAHAAARSGNGDLIPHLGELVAAAGTVFPFDGDAAAAYGSLRAHLEGVGVRLDEPSLRIASIALVHDLTLVTRSARCFDRVPGLRIENWLEPDGVEVEPEAVGEGTGDEDRGAAAEDRVVEHRGLVSSLDERAGAGASGDRVG